MFLGVCRSMKNSLELITGNVSFFFRDYSSQNINTYKWGKNHRISALWGVLNSFRLSMTILETESVQKFWVLTSSLFWNKYNFRCLSSSNLYFQICYCSTVPIQNQKLQHNICKLPTIQNSCNYITVSPQTETVFGMHIRSVLQDFTVLLCLEINRHLNRYEFFYQHQQL